MAWHQNFFAIFFICLLAGGIPIVCAEKGDSMETISNSTIANNTSVEKEAEEEKATEKPIDVKIFPETQICSFCLALVKAIKNKLSHTKREDLEKELAQLCPHLSDSKGVEICKKTIANKIDLIAKNTNQDVCINEKLCTSNQIKTAEVTKSPPGTTPFDPIPEVVKTDDEKATDVEITTQQQELVKMYTIS